MAPCTETYNPQPETAALGQSPGFQNVTPGWFAVPGNWGYNSSVYSWGTDDYAINFEAVDNSSYTLNFYFEAGPPDPSQLFLAVIGIAAGTTATVSQGVRLMGQCTFTNDMDTIRPNKPSSTTLLNSSDVIGSTGTYVTSLDDGDNLNTGWALFQPTNTLLTTTSNANVPYLSIIVSQQLGDGYGFSLGYIVPRCIELTNQAVNCIGTNMTYEWQFCVTNSSTNVFKYLDFPDLPAGVTINEDIVVLPTDLNPGEVACHTLYITNTAGLTNLCFTVGAHDADLDQCCSISNCITFTPCCVSISQESLVPLPGGCYDYTFTVENTHFPPAPAEYLMLVHLKGSPVLLFFWARWCVDCKAEVPVIARLRQEFAGEGLVVVGPTQLYGYAAQGTNASPAQERAYIESFRQRYYSSLPDMPVPLGQQNFKAYGAGTTPTLVVLNRAGQVALYHPGAMPYDELWAALGGPLRASSCGDGRLALPSRAQLGVL